MKKTHEKPICDEFIIAAIRAIRPKRSAPQGVRLSAVSELGLQAYTAVEILSAFNALIDTRRVVLVARVVSWSKDQDSWRISKASQEAIDRLAPSLSLTKPAWEWDAERNPVDKTKVQMYYSYSRLLLYVHEDGLPKRVRELLRPNRVKPITAWDIIKAMQKE